jgi:hypothetical protein
MTVIACTVHMGTDASDAAADLERPPFRGCLVCYGAEMTYYGARKLRRRIAED